MRRTHEGKFGRAVFALAAFALSGSAALASVTTPGPPADGPYIISQTYTPPPAIGLITHYKLTGAVQSVTDPFNYFGGVTANETYTGTLDLAQGFFLAPPTWDTQSYSCAANPADNVCNCGCYYTSPAYAPYSDPGTASCPSTSHAKLSGDSCVDQSTYRSGATISDDWILQPAGGNGFTLKLADGSTVSQSPTQSMFASTRYSYLTSNLVVQGGHPVAADKFVNPPDATLLCNAGTTAAGFCSAASNVTFTFNTGFQASTITINYQPFGTATPLATVTLSVAHQWIPGVVDAGGPMVWQNTWKATSAYNANDVVTFNGVTYLATNQNYGSQPDTDPVEWTPIGSSNGVGAPGPAGPQGPAGSPGPAGSQGPAGPQGLPGVAGLNGATGAAGPQGTVGAAGAQGPIGLTGSRGPAGPVGLTWVGPWSLSNPYMVGDAVSHAGSSFIAVIANTAQEPTATNPNWAALAVAGDPGQQGPIGLTGQQGPIGLTGPQGPIGLTGPQGPIGLTGSQGPIGLTGQQGPIGLTGAQGLVGPQGPAGQNLVNLPGSIATFSATAGCPGGSTRLGSGTIFYSSVGRFTSKSVVYCSF
jgi:hypothetical protein